MAARAAFRLLGPVEAEIGGRSLPLGAPKQRLLFAFLLLHANEVIPRERTIDFLWGEDPPPAPAKSLQVYVHGLRKELGSGRIDTRGTGYVLTVGSGELDLHRFDRLVSDGRAALEKGAAAVASERLTEALELWRGEPLGDLSADAIETERAVLRERRQGAQELRIDAQLALGRDDTLVAELEELIAEHPYRERLRAQHMLALYRAGRQADALAAFQAARETLADELGIDPSPELRELERAILRQDPSLRPASAAGDLKLPSPATRLVGRGLEVAAVCAALREPHVAILTLTGPGGVGKTRVAIEAAAELGKELPNGAFFVDLQTTVDPNRLGSAIASALDIGEQPGEDTVDTLARELRSREALVVLDNFERLVSAAPVLNALLQSAPRLRFLVTSRVPLRLAGEHEYPVPPLPIPQHTDDLDTLARNDSIEVFTVRARALDPQFRLSAANAPSLVGICMALDGMPLALELAAARVKLLSTDEILSRLVRPLDVLAGGQADLPPRQRTLRATIDWSHQLLTEEQQTQFARLSVFAGGCTLEAVEAVCGSTLEAFAALLDGGLLLREQPGSGPPRFRMLDPVREYAAERFDPPDAEATRERHAAFFVELAESIRPSLTGPEARRAVDRLAEEHENLRAVLDFAVARDIELGFRLTSALRRYWEMAARGREIREWLEQTLPAATGEDTPARIGALIVYARQLLDAGEYQEAPEVFARAVDAARRLRLDGDAAFALTQLGWLATAAGDVKQSEQYKLEALELARSAHDLWVERLALALLAGSRVEEGDFAGARPLLERSLAIARRLGDARALVNTLINTGWAAIRAGDFPAARAALEESLQLCNEFGYPVATVAALGMLGSEANFAGEHERARELLLQALGIGREVARPINLVEALTELAYAYAESEPAHAAQLLASADAAYEARGIVRPGPEELRAQECWATLTASLDAAALARARAAGARLELDQAIEQVLAAS
ncbi:MAG TPA: BTAD domain-containing putative transcriptional regulator [Gaiellaceae bacterium]|nr:BTAD domain-containing putative transcriptional regulator [Gaiellaceae bacterium]